MAQHKIKFGKIIDGPSKYNLDVALFYGNNDAQIPVKFTVEHETLGQILLTMTIQGVLREDGSGESWILTGYGYHDRKVRVHLELDLYFDTRSRSGFANELIHR